MWLKRQQAPKLAQVQAGQMPWQKCSTKRFHKISPPSWPRIKNWRRREKRKNKKGWRREWRWEKDAVSCCTISQMWYMQDPLRVDLGECSETVFCFGISPPPWCEVASIFLLSRQSCWRAFSFTAFSGPSGRLIFGSRTVPVCQLKMFCCWEGESSYFSNCSC